MSTLCKKHNFVTSQNLPIIQKIFETLKIAMNMD